MITVAGKSVYTTLAELVRPRHTALVVVDMQRDFCSPGGAFDVLGIDLSMYPPMVARLAELIGAARRAGVPVIFVLMTVLPGRASESPAQIRFNLRLHGEVTAADTPLLYTVEGEVGHAVIPELTPWPEDIIVRKYRSSGFWGTNLDLVLRSNAIETLVVCGCTTEGCVESTARDALFNNYYVVIPEDAVASDDRAQHDASLFLMRHRFDVVTVDEIRAEWENAELKEET